MAESGILYNLIILEPEMLISDIALTIAFLYSYFYLTAKTNMIESYPYVKYWRLFFLFEAISFFVGGIAHGFYLYLGDIMHIVGWYASIVGLFYFVLGIYSMQKDEDNKTFLHIMLSVMLLTAIAAAIFFEFNIIVVYSFLCLAAVVVINSRSKIITIKNTKAGGILIGTSLFLLAAVVHLFDVCIFYIKSGVISHILITVGVLFFGYGCYTTLYYATRKIKGKKMVQ